MPESSLSPQERVLILLNEVSTAIIEGRITPARARPALEALLKGKKFHRAVARPLDPRNEGMRDPCEVLSLNTRLRGSLNYCGPHVLRDLVQHSELWFLGRKNIGPVSIEQLKEELARWDLRLGMTPDEVEAVFGPDPRRLEGFDPETVRAIADKNIGEEYFSDHCRMLFDRANIRSLRQLLAMSEDAIRQEVGDFALKEIKPWMQHYGLRVGLSSAEIERVLGPAPDPSSTSSTPPAAE